VSVLTGTEPGAVAQPSGGEPDLQHVICCDDDLAMCGKDVTGEIWASDEEASEFCPLCFLAEEQGLPCPVPGCPAGRVRR
jgi:hypothetical protein